jgi:ABC-type oligopeptide transport system substrate-binding subunit
LSNFSSRNERRRSTTGETDMKNTTALFGVLLSAAALTGCGTTTGERTASGAAVGAATGAAIGSLSADAGKGALIGAGVGALGGYLYDQSEKRDGY